MNISPHETNLRPSKFVGLMSGGLLQVIAPLTIVVNCLLLRCFRKP